MDLDFICSKLRSASDILSLQTAAQKNASLEQVKAALNRYRNEILLANKKDTDIARKKGMSESLVERLALDNKKIDSMIHSLDIIINQNDPSGEEISGWKTPDGLTIRQVRVPLGIVAIIYESRPNVTLDAFALAYKSGNSILLRGSSSAVNSNQAILKTIKSALSQGDGVEDAIYLAPCENREEVQEILTATGKIDVVLPRGSAGLINMVTQNARIPVIQTGAGVCHLYVDESADLKMAAQIALNAKCQRPGACNAIECIVVHKSVLKEFMPLLYSAFNGKVQLRCDEQSLKALDNTQKTNAVSASENDFGFEFLDFVCAVKTVDSIHEAINFINSHNTKHSECIVTENRSCARLFQSKIDAACVYVNASTRFTDGGEFGFGAELGISTQKLHARGPMGIQALTTTKYLIDGDGQTRS